MKKNVRKLFLLFLIMALLNPVGVLAIATDEHAHESIASSGSCQFCGVNTETLCAADAWIDSTSTHTYNFGRNTCTVSYLYASGAQMCENGHVVERYSPHWCWEVHTSCGKGAWDMCPYYWTR